LIHFYKRNYCLPVRRTMESWNPSISVHECMFCCASFSSLEDVQSHIHYSHLSELAGGKGFPTRIAMEDHHNAQVALTELEEGEIVDTSTDYNSIWKLEEEEITDYPVKLESLENNNYFASSKSHTKDDYISPRDNSSVSHAAMTKLLCRPLSQNAVIDATKAVLVPSMENKGLNMEATDIDDDGNSGPEEESKFQGGKILLNPLKFSNYLSKHLSSRTIVLLGLAESIRRSDILEFFNNEGARTDDLDLISLGTRGKTGFVTFAKKRKAKEYDGKVLVIGNILVKAIRGKVIKAKVKPRKCKAKKVAKSMAKYQMEMTGVQKIVSEKDVIKFFSERGVDVTRVRLGNGSGSVVFKKSRHARRFTGRVLKINGCNIKTFQRSLSLLEQKKIDNSCALTMVGLSKEVCLKDLKNFFRGENCRTEYLKLLQDKAIVVFRRKRDFKKFRGTRVVINGRPATFLESGQQEASHFTNFNQLATNFLDRLAVELRSGKGGAGPGLREAGLARSGARREGAGHGGNGSSWLDCGYGGSIGLAARATQNVD